MPGSVKLWEGAWAELVSSARPVPKFQEKAPSSASTSKLKSNPEQGSGQSTSGSRTSQGTTSMVKSRMILPRGIQLPLSSCLNSVTMMPTTYLPTVVGVAVRVPVAGSMVKASSSPRPSGA